MSATSLRQAVYCSTQHMFVGPDSYRARVGKG